MKMTRSSQARYISLFVLVVFSLFLVTSVVNAQDAPATPAASNEVSPNEVKAVSKQLWCPLCSGVRLDACELKACEQMRDVIAVKLGEGESDQEIKDYFVAQYGPQVLGEPPLEGFNWLAWILPVAVMVGGGIFLWFRTRSMIGGRKQEVVGTSTAAGGEDDYSRKLDEELKHYD